MSTKVRLVVRPFRFSAHSIFIVLLFTCCVMILPGTAIAVWDVKTLADSGSSTISLLDQDRSVVTTVSRESCIKLLEVKDKLERHVGIHTDLYLIDAPTPNAFATSNRGRYVVGVTLPLFRLFDSDEHILAAVMGHELAHLARGHIQKSATTDTILGVLGAIIGIVLEQKFQKRYDITGLGVGAADLATDLVSRTFSRAQEREADRLGLDWMVAAGFDPNAAVRFWQKMFTLYGDEIPLFSTHPSSRERLVNLQTQIDGMPPYHAAASVPSRQPQVTPSVPARQFSTITSSKNNVRLTVEVQYYDVTATDVAPLNREIFMIRGPIGQNGKRFASTTRWDIQWKFRHEKDRSGRCEMKEVLVKVDVRHIFPNWLNADQVPPEYAARWNAFMDALKSLHSLYQENGTMAADEIQSVLLGAPNNVSCEALAESANSAAQNVIRKYQSRDEEIQRTTMYGRTLGAAFPW